MASAAPAAGRQETSLTRGLGKTRGDGGPVDHASGAALTTLTAPTADMMVINREDTEYGADWRTNLGSKDSGRAGGSNLLFREGKQVDGRIGSSSVPNGALAAAAVAAAVATTAPPVPPSHANMARPIARIAVQERKMAHTMGLDGRTNGDRLVTSTSVSSSDQQVFREDNIIIKSRAKMKIMPNSTLATTDSGSLQCKTNRKGKTRVSSSGGAAAGNVSHSVGGHYRRTGGNMEKSIANAHHSSTAPSSSPRNQQSTMFKHGTTSSSSSSRSSSRNSTSSSSSGGSHSPTNTFAPISSSSSSSSGSGSSSSGSNYSSTTNGVSRMPVATQRRTSGASSSSNSIDGDGSERVVMEDGMEDVDSTASKIKRRRRSNRSPTNTLPCRTQPLDDVSEGTSGRRSRRRLNSSCDSSTASGPASLNGVRIAGGAVAAAATTGVELDSTGLAGGEADVRLAGGLGSGGQAPAKKRRTSAKDSSSSGASGAAGNGAGSAVSGGRAGSGRSGASTGRGRGRGKGRGRGRRKGASLLEGLAPRGPSNKARDTLRWRTHRMVEDYVNTCGSIMYPNVTVSSFGYNPTEGQFPLERPSTLGMLRTQIRRPTVIEKWSPYQVALFEGAISIHGKVRCFMSDTERNLKRREQTIKCGHLSRFPWE